MQLDSWLLDSSQQDPEAVLSTGEPWKIVRQVMKFRRLSPFLPPPRLLHSSWTSSSLCQDLACGMRSCCTMCAHTVHMCAHTQKHTCSPWPVQLLRLQSGDPFC